MHLLIIGGTGVLSSAVTEEALRQGISVSMINRGNRQIPKGVELIKSDRDNLEYIARQIKGRTFDAVMDYLCYTDSETKQSAQFYKKYTKQYFYISSCAVYNTVSSTVMIGLKQCIEAETITPGMKVMISDFGVGLSWGGTILSF